MKYKKSMIPKMLMVMVVVGAWMVYFNPSLMRQFTSGKISQVTTEVAQSVKRDIVKTVKAPIVKEKGSETVYKWRDEDGKLHYSNNPPANARNVEKQNIDINQNALGSGKPATSSSTKSSASQSFDTVSPRTNTDTTTFSSYKDAIDKAQAARKQMEQRNRQLDQMAR